MTISLRPTENLHRSAALTYDNMREYYEHYSVPWRVDTILEQITTLRNWDIALDDIVVGALRLMMQDDECWIRDLQVDQFYQNQGVGQQTLEAAYNRALTDGADFLKLRVFKISPAYRLYDRFGFEIFGEEDRFFYMKKTVLGPLM